MEEGGRVREKGKEERRPSTRSRFDLPDQKEGGVMFTNLLSCRKMR